MASQDRNALYYIAWFESVHYDRSARSRSGRCIAIGNSRVFDFEQGAALGRLYLLGLEAANTGNPSKPAAVVVGAIRLINSTPIAGREFKEVCTATGVKPDVSLYGCGG